jgi:hypothetical protein
VEARRVCRNGATVGIADADRGGGFQEPADPRLQRGGNILERLRGHANPFVGRQLRGLLHEAGFVGATAIVKAVGGGDPWRTPLEAEFQAAFFDAPEAVAHAVAEGVATADEMAAIASAWRAWGANPGATSAGHWFEVTARAPAAPA